MKRISSQAPQKKFVVITTINTPNRRVLEYRDLGYEIVVIGDAKTDDSIWSKFAINEGLDYLGLRNNTNISLDCRRHYRSILILEKT